MQESYDFAQDIDDPVNFILDDEVSFLHRFNKYAKLLYSDKIDSNGMIRVGRKLASEINNYRLVLTCFQGKIH